MKEVTRELESPDQIQLIQAGETSLQTGAEDWEDFLKNNLQLEEFPPSKDLDNNSTDLVSIESSSPEPYFDSVFGVGIELIVEEKGADEQGYEKNLSRTITTTNKINST